jgi:hypothetical protein
MVFIDDVSNSNISDNIFSVVGDGYVEFDGYLTLTNISNNKSDGNLYIRNLIQNTEISGNIFDELSMTDTVNEKNRITINGNKFNGNSIISVSAFNNSILNSNEFVEISILSRTNGTEVKSNVCLGDFGLTSGNLLLVDGNVVNGTLTVSAGLTSSTISNNISGAISCNTLVGVLFVSNRSGNISINGMISRSAFTNNISEGAVRFY